MPITARGAIQAAKAYREATKGDVVSNEEIVRRTHICNACDLKRGVIKIAQKVASRLATVANKNRVHADMNGKSCGVCECPLMLLIPAKRPHEDSPEEAEKRPDSCWITRADTLFP